MPYTAEELKAIQKELEWITLKEESRLPFWEQAKLKCFGNPVVPIGCLVTAGILSRGIFHLLKKDRVMQQKYMRYRVLAQGITLLICYGSVKFLSAT